MEISSAVEDIESLRGEYKYFDQYLEGKDLNDYEQLLWAYKYEIKNYSRDVSFNLRLDDELIDKQASKVLFLIRDIVNLSKVKRTQVFLGVLIQITEASNWKELNTCLMSFKSNVDCLDQTLFNNAPDDEIEALALEYDLDPLQKVVFNKFLLLKLFRYVGQKRESPPLYIGLIEGGILKNEPNFISESTYKRYKANIDCSNSILLKLLDVLDDYKENIVDLIIILSTYRLNFNSTYLKNLPPSDNIAIKIPKYKDVDYKSILAIANQNLDSLNPTHRGKEISMDKIVLFLFLVNYFNDPFVSDRIYVSSAMFSKVLGDSKVVSSIRDAFENYGIFSNKRNAIMEVESCSYIVSISFDIDEYLKICNPLLIKKLNQDININSSYFIEERLDFLESVINLIHSNNLTKNLNLTQTFLQSGKISPLLYFLKVISALKANFRQKKFPNVDPSLAESFVSLDYDLSNSLYQGALNKFYSFLSSNRNFIGFYIPTLELVTEKQVKDELRKKYRNKYKKKYIKKYIKGKSDEYLKEYKDMRIELMKPLNHDYIEKLKLFCGVKDKPEDLI